MASRKRKTAHTQAHVEWLSRDVDFVEGLDHLGLQVVSTNIYARLVPGISNLTDRARYFSFYSWVLDSFARRATDKSADGWRTWVRRHEFALSAAGVSAERNQIGKHAAGGLIGAITARRLTKKAMDVDIDAATRLENGKAATGTYFQNREGGYAQYYKGPMTALGLLRVDEGRKAPDRQLTAYAGAKLAQTVEKIPAFRELRAIALEGRQASVAELADLGAVVHPGAMDRHSPEAELLRDLLLGTDAVLCAGQIIEETDQRRRSLALVLHYVQLGDQDDWRDHVWGFRWSILERRLGDGRAWDIPAPLLSAAVAWAAYSQNELLNYALECFFYAAISVLGEETLAPRALARRLAEWACASASTDRSTLAGRTLPDTLSRAVHAHSATAPAACWEADGTFSLQDELEDSDEPAEVCARASRLLLRVAADRSRYTSRHPFATIPRGDDIARAREIHLASFWDRIDAAANQGTREFFEELILDWVLYRHLRVATRKLATQGDYTYRVRPEEGELVKCGIFEPTFTNPRLKQALRMLADIGLATHDLGATTDEGDRFLRTLS